MYGLQEIVKINREASERRVLNSGASSSAKRAVRRSQAQSYRCEVSAAVESGLAALKASGRIK
jgi:hypothetical protein